MRGRIVSNCETWSDAIREPGTLTSFENKLMRKCLYLRSRQRREAGERKLHKWYSSRSNFSLNIKRKM